MDIVILTDSVINLKPVLGSPLVVHLAVVLSLGNNPTMIAADFEFSGRGKEGLVEREREDREEKKFVGGYQERSHFWTFRGALANLIVLADVAY